VTAVVGQYAPALDCGTVDPEEMVPQFLQALENVGMNDIIAENQKQLDAWLAEQEG
jgi:putative aldouronate transport system substrate-binding protein